MSIQKSCNAFLRVISPVIHDIPIEQAALAAESAADPAPLDDHTLAALNAYAEGREIERAAACAELPAHAQAWDRWCAALNGARGSGERTAMYRTYLDLNDFLAHSGASTIRESVCSRADAARRRTAGW